MSYLPGGAYNAQFCTQRFDTGAATNADSLPTATATRNGTDDVTFTLTVTNMDTGRYKISGTIPAGYAKGDAVQVSVAATVNGVAGKAVIDSFVLDSKRVGDLNDIAATAIVSGGAITTSGGIAQADVQTIKTQTVTCSAGVTVNANVGTTQPLNFTGTGASALVKGDTIDVGGVPQTGGDIYAAITASVITGAPLNATAASETLTTGTGAGGVANTADLDGVYDTWTAVGNAIDGYYQFDLSGTTGGTAVSVTWDGYLAGIVNSLKVYYWNWAGSVWKQIGTLAGIAGTLVGAQDFDLPPGATGTGGNLGLVRIRFQNTGLVAGVLNTDRILLGYAQVLTPPANWSTTIISSDGYSAIDWSAIKAPTTTVSLSGTTIGTVSTLTTYTGNTPQTGDAFARLGVAGVGLTNLGDTRIANLDAAVSTRMATYTQPTGFLAATFPSGTIANTTNIAAGTITTVTNLTNAPTAGDFTAAMKTSLNAATPAVTISDKTGFKLASDGLALVTSWTVNITGNITGNLLGTVSTLTTYTGNTPQTGDAFARIGLAGVGLTNLGDARFANLDATVSSRLATSGYTAPNNTGIATIIASTAGLTFTVAGQVDANIQYVNDVQVAGTGATGNEWGPA
jgi:hypothetical protein